MRRIYLEEHRWSDVVRGISFTSDFYFNEITQEFVTNLNYFEVYALFDLERIT